MIVVIINQNLTKGSFLCLNQNGNVYSLKYKKDNLHHTLLF
nr:MAG TPA: FGF and basic fibroblast growth factor family [Caudoviricetes sp.]DAR28751.1 MAG TPA: FGF and basic fibroblast growth factor family [Herelleviridae sp.]